MWRNCCYVGDCSVAAATMAVQSKLMDILPTHYGCVVFTGVGSLLVNLWLVSNVMRARKQYNVKVKLLCCMLVLFLLSFLSTASHTWTWPKFLMLTSYYLHTYSVRAFYFGCHVCRLLSVICLSCVKS